MPSVKTPRTIQVTDSPDQAVGWYTPTKFKFIVTKPNDDGQFMIAFMTDRIDFDIAFLFPVALFPDAYEIGFVVEYFAELCNFSMWQVAARGLPYTFWKDMFATDYAPEMTAQLQAYIRELKNSATVN